MANSRSGPRRWSRRPASRAWWRRARCRPSSDVVPPEPTPAAQHGGNLRRIRRHADLDAVGDRTGRPGDPPVLHLEDRCDCVEIWPSGSSGVGASMTTGSVIVKLVGRRVRAGVGAVEGAHAPVVGAAGAERLGQPVARPAVAAPGATPIGLVQHALEVGVRRQLELHGQRAQAGGAGVLDQEVERLVCSLDLLADGRLEGLGAVMFTPGIGPATSGLSGLALLLCWQAAAAAPARPLPPRHRRACSSSPAARDSVGPPAGGRAADGAEEVVRAVSVIGAGLHGTLRERTRVPRPGRVACRSVSPQEEQRTAAHRKQHHQGGAEQRHGDARPRRRPRSGRRRS